MNNLILFFEEDYIKKNNFLLVKSELNFMKQRFLLALMTFLSLLLVSAVIKDLSFIIFIPIGVVGVYMYPLYQLKQYKKNMAKRIENDFPIWLMQLEVLVLTNTIPNAIKKSINVCPNSLKEDIVLLSNKVMVDPTNKSYYLDFIKPYQTSDITEVLLSLYQFNFANKQDLAYDFHVLHNRMDVLKTKARSIAYEEKGFYYGLILLAEPMVACVWILGMVMLLSNLLTGNI
ncbi:MAG: hypothetical protein RR909_03165 [Bacilli bacterium]